MVALPDDYLTAGEYLVAERQAENKHELINGCAYAMSGASTSHVRISMNIAGNLFMQLRGKTCEVFSSDMRVKVPRTTLYTYPDVIIACEPQVEDDAFDTLLNPIVIFEILSPSTENFDRGEKFGHYQLLASLTDYVLVAQGKRRVEHYHRLDDQQWLLKVAEMPDEVIAFESVGCTLKVLDVYERVQLPDTVDRLNSLTAPH